MREGRIEVTATLGNQVCGLCSHEELIRLLYPSFRLKRRFGVPIASAELNDIPGFSWGLASVLSGSGVRYFAPGIQDYFAWGRKVRPNWDEQAVIARDMLGAFWWEGPDGSRVLLWYGGPAIEGPHLWTYDQARRDLAKYLAGLQRRGYPYELVRLKFLGGMRDNSPPDVRLSRIVREWNERWAWPKLLVSTNTRFFEKFERQYGGQLKTLRGELPDTDYPVGAASTAKETGVNRLAHDTLAAAETLASCATMVSDYAFPAATLAEAWDAMLLYDEHSWGMAHPIGPAQDASLAQKRELAYRGAALAHDVLVKSANRLADGVRLDGDGYHVVVFNPLSWKRTDIVRLPGHAPEACSHPMYRRSRGDVTELAASSVIGRRVVELPPDLLDKPFELIDLSTGKAVPHQVINYDDPLAARPLAAERFAMGHVSPTSQAGLNYDRSGAKDLVFLALEVPAVGYKVYRMVPGRTAKPQAGSLHVSGQVLQNRFYRITLDPQSGAVASIIDKEDGRELVDQAAPHRLHQLVVRSPESGEVFAAEHSRITMGERGPVMASLVVRGDGKGCAQRVQEITLYEGLKRIDFATRLLKDAQPLLELYLAFPFALEGAEWRFEGAGAVVEPIRDQWPGSNTDTYVVQHWVSARDRRGGVTLSSLEAPLVKLGGLWPDSMSQAQHGVTSRDYGRPFLRDPKDMAKGHVYSYAMAINFRTNFALVQVSDVLFRYAITSHAGDWRQGRSCEFGHAAASPLAAVPIKGPQQGLLPESDGFCRIDKPNIVLLAMKAAEDGNGLVLRLAETEGAPAVASVTLPHYDVRAARAANLVEEQQGELEHDGHTVKVPVRTHGTATVRLTGGSN
jgi:hypothetical protein